ncbi:MULTISPECIES: NUDIX domain-containing protein [Roseobacteraceae]|uniref:NUDIX hydrolase n=1 Tax=Roseobacteraceae TaxID=2854170 RepID=UPI00329A2940
MLFVKSYSVSIFLLKPDGAETKVLLLRRTGSLPGLWCQVAGGIEAGEKAWQTAIREVHEETGIVLTEIWSADIVEQFYEVAKDCITLVPVFVSRVPADSTVVLNDEHDAYEWVSFETASAMLSFPGQQKALAAVKAEFVDRKPNPHLKIAMNG